MELSVMLLAGVVILIGAIGWLCVTGPGAPSTRARHATLRRPLSSIELRSAGIRSRYKLAHGGILLHRGASSLGQTAQVQVHRDELDDAYRVRGRTTGDGRGH